MIEHSEVLKLHDEAYTSSQDIRQKAADDLLFARVTQWDDPYLNTQLEYRGQFDQIRKARRQNLAEMRANPVQVTYIAGRDANEDAADILERKYRFDMSTPTAKQAAIISQQDQLDCGFGAWRLVTDYENSVTNEQYIMREPIHEANNRVFVDPNANMPDGSDARYIGVIWTVTELGWPDFAASIGLDPDDIPASFEPPEDTYTFPWSTDTKDIHILEFYLRSKVKRVAYRFENELGDERYVKDEDFDDIVDELLQEGFMLDEEGEREYDTYEVTKSWVSGSDILKTEIIAGTMIPIVLVWGEVSKVEGQWVWEGIVRLAKDPQRLRNFMMSYIADIAAKGGRRRPIFTMSQVQGLEWQWDESDPDNNRPFKVINDYDEDGRPLSNQAIGYEEPPQMPQAAAGLLEAASGAIDDVTNPGIPQDVADVDLSGKAVMALQNRVDMQTYTFLDNYTLALQREAEIYASMVPAVYDTPREIGLLSEDGTEEVKTINDRMFDMDSGKMVPVYDLTKGEYRVRTKVTASYSSRREQERAAKLELYSASDASPQAQQVLLFEIMMLGDNSNDASRKFARRQLIDMGLVEPESDEDKQYLEQKKQQQEQPDPMMVAAMAEDKKAQADIGKVKIDEMNAQTNQFEAQTKRIQAMVAAQEAGIKIEGMEIDNIGRVAKIEKTQLEAAAIAKKLGSPEAAMT